MTMTSEIPVWVDGVEKWVTGVGRRTTCADLVQALLSSDRRAPPSEHELRAHAIVERWRQVERPLDGAARIQKVWRTWGDDTAEVRFTLKRLGPMTPKEVKTPRRRQRHRWRSSSSLEAVHPRKLGAEPDTALRNDVVERLMQTIIVQGETIAAQLRRLHEREDLIGYYEHKMHRMREDELGADYLLRTYLRDGEPAEAEKASHDSGVGAELAADAPEMPPRDVSEEEAVSDLRQTLLYLERVVELNSRIAEQEEAALRLGHKVRRAEVARLAALCARQTAEIEQNERALTECDRLLGERRRRLLQLERELDDADSETSRLLAERLSVAAYTGAPLAEPRWTAPTPAPAPLPTPAPAPATHKDVSGGDGDSNSDTGLSSLHSSSDEAAAGYVLDTLV